MRLDDLTEPAPTGEDLAPLDRPGAEPTSPQERCWIENGYILLERFIPDELIDAYCQDWRQVNDETTGISRWPETAYMHSRAARELCLYDPLVEHLEPLVGGKPGLHLCLTNWRSTTRDWHQDDYLNPPFVNSWYAATWIALADIPPTAGPFELVPRSHHWERLRRDRVVEALGLSLQDPMWPAKSEAQLTPLVEAEIKRRRAQVWRPNLKRGDVLIWHGCLYHRGTVPEDPTAERRSMIAHYSARDRRRDMAVWQQHGRGCYFRIDQPLKEAS